MTIPSDSFHRIYSQANFDPPSEPSNFVLVLLYQPHSSALGRGWPLDSTWLLASVWVQSMKSFQENGRQEVREIRVCIISTSTLLSFCLAMAVFLSLQTPLQHLAPSSRPLHQIPSPCHLRFRNNDALLPWAPASLAGSHCTFHFYLILLVSQLFIFISWPLILLLVQSLQRLLESAAQS